MPAYKFSESVRLAPYYADFLGAPIKPDEDGNVPEKDEYMQQDGKPRVFNMPMEPGDIAYTDPGDYAKLSDEDKEGANRVLYSPFPNVYKSLKDRKFSNLEGEYSAVEELKSNDEEPKKAPRATNKGAQKPAQA